MKRYSRAEKQIVMNAESVAEAVDVTARMYANIGGYPLSGETISYLFLWSSSLEGRDFWECYNNNTTMRD